MRAGLGVFQVLPATSLKEEKRMADESLTKAHKFIVEITVTAGMDTTPQTFNLNVTQAYGLSIEAGEPDGYFTLSRFVAAGKNEFYRFLDENWIADIMIIMDNIRFTAKNCTVSQLYYGPLDKAENVYLTETIEVKYDLLTPAYHT